MTGIALLEEIEAAAPGAPDKPSAVERLILKHAMRSFGRKGYAGTTLRGIASDVGVTAPLVSYYFKSKENLFVEVTRIVMESLNAEVALALQSPRPFHESVAAAVEAHVRLAECCPAAVEFMFTMLYGPSDGQPRVDLNALWRETRDRILEVFEAGIASGEFIPRPGVSPTFLVHELGNLIHSQASVRFKAARIVEQSPALREEIQNRLDEVSLDTAIEHFFFGAGQVPGLERRNP